MFRLHWLTLPLLAVAAAGIAFATTYVPFFIHFRVGSDRLDHSELAQLDRIAAMMAEHPEMYLFVDGHANRAGSESHNLRLSCRRARSVHDFLLAKGVAAGRMAIRAYGESRALEGGPGDPEQLSRRVEVSVTIPEIFADRRHPPLC